MSPAHARRIVRQYAELLRERRIAFHHVYLFGSYATGRTRQESDIDVAIVTKKAAG